MGRHHKNIKIQLNKALDAQLRIGQKKQKIYDNPNKAAGIHSIKTAQTYRSSICTFGDYLKGQGIRDMKDIGEREVKGFLDSRSDLSAWTLSKDRESDYVPFEVKSNNRAMIGYTSAENEELVIPATFQGEDGTWYKVTSIGSGAFHSCDSLTSVTIPNSVTYIGTAAFHYCGSLTSVTIPDSVTSIGDYAFSHCRSLTSITIPDAVTSIGTWAFYNCTSLESVTIPNRVTSIGRDAFYNVPHIIYNGSYEKDKPWGAKSIN